MHMLVMSHVPPPSPHSWEMGTCSSVAFITVLGRLASQARCKFRHTKVSEHKVYYYYYSHLMQLGVALMGEVLEART